MMQSKLRWIRTALIFICAILISGVLSAQFSGGSGTIEDPFLVSSAEDLNQIRESRTAHFRQVADIDLGGAPWTSGAGWEPIGESDGTPFTGSFDGNGYLIRNLRINRLETPFVGLFGFLGNTGRLENVGLVDVDVRGWFGVGALAAFNFGTIDGSFATGLVRGTGNSVGGLVGENHFVVSGAYFSGETEGAAATGGLVGANQSGGSIERSYVRGVVHGQGADTGGLVGFNAGAVGSVWADAVVEGGENVGGLLGRNSSGGTVSRSYARGLVEGRDGNVGGLCGLNAGTVDECYAAAEVRGPGGTSGGLIGLAGGESTLATNSYWDTEISDQTGSAGGTGEPTAVMQQTSTYAGWNFTDTWGLPGPAGYPHLRAMRYRVWAVPFPLDAGVVSGAGSRFHGEMISLSAAAGAGSTFRHWREDGEILSDSVDYSFAVTRDHFLEARMTRESYTLTYVAGPGGTLSGESEQVVQFQGSGSSILAVPEEGAVFDRWSDGLPQNPRTDTGIEDDLLLTARFRTERLVPVAWYVENQMTPGTGQNWGDLDFVDSDQNGVPNWLEYFADTNPRDPRSRLRIVEVSAEVPFIIRFAPVSSDRNYLLYTSDSMVGGNWQEVPAEKIAAFTIEGGVGAFRLSGDFWQDPDWTLPRYFRVRVLLP